MFFKTKYLQLLLLLFILSFPKAEAQKISAGIVSSLDFYFYELKKDSPNDYKQKVNYSFGGQFLYQLSEKLTLKTGLLYSRQSYELSVDSSQLFFKDQWDSYSNNNSPAYIKYDLFYWEVPLVLMYRINVLNKVVVFVSSGISAGIFSKGTSDLSGHPSRIRGTNNQSVILSLGIKYNASRKMYILIEPYSKNYFQLMNDKQSQGPMAVGCTGGVYYKF